ncbi:MAG TPA: hypothetical protein EYM44_05470 [Gammaproteobacteria bacterium]|jgi:hypothetical protein|nr:hypothetical protein [Gammaproteobacteria bacterium]
MLTKLLFTAIVIIIVLLVFRTRHHKTKPPAPTINHEPPGIGISARVIAYTLLIVVLAVSAVIFTLHWSEQHRVIDIRVTNAQGEVTRYQAHKKTIQGRRFITLEGVTVNLGDSFQVEMIEQLDSH